MSFGEHVHRQTRSTATTWGIAGVAVLLCLAVDAFHVPRALFFSVVAAIAGATVLATWTHAHFGFASRGYHAANRVETVIWCFGSTALVAAGHTAVTLAWLPYLVVMFHGGRAATYQKFNTIVFALAPLSVAVVFAARSAWHDMSVVCALTLGALVLHRALVQATTGFAELLAQYSQDEERLRIARDLHDGLGAQLNAMLWTARALQRRQPSAEANAVERGLSRSLDDLGSLVWALREHDMGFAAFVARVRARVNELFSEHMRIEVRVEGDDAVLPSLVAVNALHVVLEAIRNAIAHSGGQRVIVTLAWRAELCVTIEDDGRGIAPHAHAVGHGLLHMQERATKSGGRLQIEALTPGTRVRLTHDLRGCHPLQLKRK